MSIFQPWLMIGDVKDATGPIKREAKHCKINYPFTTYRITSFYHILDVS